MGGSTAPQPQQTARPIPVSPFSNYYLGPVSQPQPLQPGSSKGGTMSGIPDLDVLFNAPQTGAPVFPASQSFPNSPLVPSNSAGAGVPERRLLPMPGAVPLQPAPGFGQDARGLIRPNRPNEGPIRD